MLNQSSKAMLQMRKTNEHKSYDLLHGTEYDLELSICFQSAVRFPESELLLKTKVKGDREDIGSLEGYEKELSSSSQR